MEAKELKIEHLDSSTKDTLFSIAELLRKIEKYIELETVKNEVRTAEYVLYEILNDLHIDNPE